MTHAASPLPDDQGHTPEPVAIAAAVQAVLVAAAALGWVVVDNTAIASVGTAVAAVGTVAAVLVARGRVRAIRPDDPAPAPAAGEVDPEQLRAAVAAELAALGVLPVPPAAPTTLLGSPRPRPYAPRP